METKGLGKGLRLKCRDQGLRARTRRLGLGCGFRA